MMHDGLVNWVYEGNLIIYVRQSICLAVGRTECKTQSGDPLLPERAFPRCQRPVREPT